MRLGLAGGVIVVLVVFAIVMLQPGSQRLATAFSGLNPPGAQLQDGSLVLIVNAALLSRRWDYWSGATQSRV